MTQCLFEFVYFARPDSIIENVYVQKARMRMGNRLAKKVQREWADHDIDVVIPIPDTSRIFIDKDNKLHSQEPSLIHI